MSTKKILRTATLALLIAVSIPASSAIIAPGTAEAKTENSRTQQLVQRLEYIKGMDKSDMTRLEKKAIRKEVVEIKKEMKAITGGVYLSVGAIIIVILLLILLL